jgi:outer membrane receptor for ferrienterochelin and colicins
MISIPLLRLIRSKGILFIYAALLSAFSTRGQEDCKQSYVNARQAYAIGNFAAVKAPLKACLQKGGKIDVTDRIQYIELLALTDIALDSLGEAKDKIREILQLDQVFIQTDVDLKNIVFGELMTEIREEMLGQVSSVSKKPERLQLAPANVRLITRQDIIDRGYLDIVDLLSDLPGFHVSRIFGQAHSNIYQLGYRQDNTERTLLMVDGVEENDLWSNWAYFSRQYPLSNIKAVEVIYGPSSAMYGPRAFVGTVNIITLDPKELGKDKLLHGEKLDQTRKQNGYQRVQLTGHVQGGDFQTRVGDLTLQLRGKSDNVKSSKFSMQMTGRVYLSDEHDMSGEEFFNYDTSDISNFRYDFVKNLNPTPIPGVLTLENYLSTFKMQPSHAYYKPVYNSAGVLSQLVLTDSGMARARALDRAAYARMVNGAPLSAANTTENYFFSTKIRIEDVQIGLRLWKMREGYGFFQDINDAGAKNGSIWAPINATFYVKFEKKFFNNVSLTNLTNFTINRLGKETNRVNFMSFGDPQTPLHLAHLLSPDSTLPTITGLKVSEQSAGGANQVVINYNKVRHGWRNTFYYYEAQQVRNETRLFYDSKRFNLLAGVDLRGTQTQGDYMVYQDFDTDYKDVSSYQNKLSETAYARENGVPQSAVAGGNMFSIFDAGLYGLASYHFTKRFIASFGTRADVNMVRSSELNVIATPRLALVYHRDRFSMKLTSSSGYQGISQYQRYATGFGRKINEDLNNEVINYVDLSLNGQARKNKRKPGSLTPFEWDLSGYFCQVDSAVGLVKQGDSVFNDNVGRFHILGAMGGFQWTPREGLRISGNYTFTRAEQRDTMILRLAGGPLPLGDIARHMGNLSATWIIRKAGPFNISANIRANYMSDRPVGRGTTQFLNYGLDSAANGKIPAYLVFHGNLGLALAAFPRFRVDLTVQNLLDRNLLDSKRKTYYHPGAREASGSFNMPWDIPGKPFADAHVPFIPQRGRFLLLKLMVDL